LLAGAAERQLRQRRLRHDEYAACCADSAERPDGRWVAAESGRAAQKSNQAAT
jgi:hypothetical protein